MLCLVLGASAGHGALTAPLCDFAVMTETASIFAAGPPLVKSATGEDVTKEVLGGPQVAAARSGVVHNVVADDVEAIALARRYLGYFPLNAWEPPPGGAVPMPARGGWTRCWPSSRPTLAARIPSARSSKRSPTTASCSRCSRASAARS
jgi:acetyl-CoA carboxylase carboxyltransferase component